MAVPTPKGKGKANQPTPLVDENGLTVHTRLSRNEIHQTVEDPHLLSPSRVWRSYLWTAVLAILSLFFGMILAIILLADSYAAPALHNINGALSQSGEGSDKFWKQAMLVCGPDAVRMTGVGWKRDEREKVQLEVNMTVTMRMAIDTDFIMDFRNAPEDTWWRDKWRALGRWSVRWLGSTTVVVDDAVVNPSKFQSPEPLITVKFLSPITIPLLPGLSEKDHSHPPASLETVFVPLTIYPSQNASLMAKFFKQSWVDGHVSVQVHGSNLSIHGGSERNEPSKVWEPGRWRNLLKFDKDDLLLDLTLPVPTLHIPSFPPSKPGSELPKLSDILVLESFNITSVPSNLPLPSPESSSKIHVTDIGIPLLNNDRHQGVLAGQSIAEPSTGNSLIHVQFPAVGWSTLIIARAAMAHPFGALTPKLDFGHNFPPLPFVVSLPVPAKGNASGAMGQVQSGVIPVVEVFTMPEINATHIRIPLSGHVLPFSDTSARLPDAISAFVSSYLSYRPSPISISSSLYPSLEISAEFPPPAHRLELLRDVRIDNMSIHPGMETVILPTPGLGTSFLYYASGIRMMDILASATVYARVVLPRGISIDVHVTRLWVDCFVFDGKVPAESRGTWGQSQSKPEPSAVTPLSDDDEEPPLPQPLPLPTPLPIRAFGRITPRSWLNATSSSAPQHSDSDKYHGDASAKNADGSGTNVFVTAQLVDVPLEVLPGRQGDLSRFVTKVLFSKEPAVAGIRGVAAVGLSIPGLTIPASEPRIEGNELILTGLPFEGNVKVGGHDF